MHRTRYVAAALMLTVVSGGLASSTQSDKWVAIIGVDDFSTDTAGWIESDWDAYGKTWQTANDARVDKDGALRLYLRPYTGDEAYHGHHGNTVTRPLPLYGDFEVICGLEWDRKSKYSIFKARLALVGASAGSSEAAVEMVGGKFNAWPGKIATATNMVPLPQSGKATVRFTKHDGVLSIYWDETLVAKSERHFTVTHLRLTARTYRTQQVAGSYVGLARLQVKADDAGLPLLEEPVRQPESLLAGGDFQGMAEGELGVALDVTEEPVDQLNIPAGMTTGHEGPRSLGVGRLEGWATRVDGKHFVWFKCNEAANERALLLDVRGKPQGVSFSSSSFRLRQGKHYVLTGLVQLSDTTIAQLRLGPPSAAPYDKPLAQWQAVTARRRGPTPYPQRRIVRNWVPMNIPLDLKNSDELVLTLSVLPASAGAPFGTAAFDKLAIREVTARDRLCTELESLMAATIAVRREQQLAGECSEVALDIAGFDIDEAPASKRKHEVQTERRALSDWIESKGERAGQAAIDTARQVGAVLIFLNRLPTTEIEIRVARLRGVLASWEATESEWQKRAATLRRAASALRPAAAPAPDYANSIEWARNRFHIYWFNHYGLTPPGLAESIRYMGAMGATALQIKPYDSRRHNTWEEYEAYVRRHLDLCKREGMKVFIYGASGPIGGSGPERRKSTRSALNRYIEAFGDDPAFAGFEADEISSREWPDFPKYLRARFTKAELIELGIISSSLDELDRIDRAQDKTEQAPEPTMGLDGADPEDDDTSEDMDLDDIFGEKAPTNTIRAIEGPLTSLTTTEFRKKSLTLFMIGLEWRAQSFEQSLAAGIEFAHSLKEDLLFMPLFSPVIFLGSPFNGSLPGVSAVSDMVAIDPYWNGVPEEALYCDLMKSNARGPALLTVGTHYGGNPDSLARDLAISFAHTDGVYIFDWPFCFKHKGPYPHYWYPAGKWQKVWAFARKASAIEPYLVHVRSAAEAAMLYSERSCSVDYYQKTQKGMGNKLQAGRYAISQMGLYCLFLQSHLAMDSLYVEGQTTDSLKRYKVLVVQDAMSMTEAQETLIRDWVHQGGCLIATASTSLRDRWGRTRNNYGLSDVFGARHVKTEQSEGTRFGAEPKVTYGKSRCFDEVKPTSGKTIGSWEDGRPAVIENKFGAGRCVFVAARDLGNCCARTPRGRDGPRWYLKTHKKYAPGVREFMAGLVTDCLLAQGRELPFVARRCPEYVETVMRVQSTDRGRRRILHLLNYSFNEPIKDVVIEVPVPPGNTPRAFYPVDDTVADATVTKTTNDARTLAIRVRDFNVHECIVVED